MRRFLFHFVFVHLFLFSVTAKAMGCALWLSVPPFPQDAWFSMVLTFPTQSYGEDPSSHPELKAAILEGEQRVAMGREDSLSVGYQKGQMFFTWLAKDKLVITIPTPNELIRVRTFLSVLDWHRYRVGVAWTFANYDYSESGKRFVYWGFSFPETRSYLWRLFNQGEEVWAGKNTADANSLRLLIGRLDHFASRLENGTGVLLVEMLPDEVDRFRLWRPPNE